MSKGEISEITATRCIDRSGFRGVKSAMAYRLLHLSQVGALQDRHGQHPLEDREERS